MLEFGKLEVVEKTFTRKDVSPRGQSYVGIKFRRYDSKNAVTPGLKELFVISDKAFESLNLKNYALAEAKYGNDVYLLVVEDQDKVKPEAKFMRQSNKKDGTVLEKGTIFNNVFMKDDLIAVGVLDATTHENQYLALEETPTADLPSVVKAVYKIVKDTSVDASADQEDGQEEVAAVAENRGF